jgi:diguanylate cyclase (GGDEF)-like protein/PAS domain S-box-containing protein
VNDELRPYYERAHIISMASFPVFVQDQMLGTITFCGSEQHEFGETETEFLWSLVAQAGPTIKAFRLNRELREAEQRLRAVFSNAPVFITVFEPDGTILLSEGAGLGGLGQVAGGLVGQSIYSALPEPFHETLRSNIERGLLGENFDSNLRIGERDYQTRYAALRDDDGQPTAVIGVTMDISEQLGAQRELEAMNREFRAAKEQAEFLASHDVLTGVLSRRAWFEAADDLPVAALAVLDIDRFKGINDRWGHPAGDAVLRTVAQRIEEAVGPRGLVGRIGGEEFGILFVAPVALARNLCQSAVDAVSRERCTLPDGTEISVSVSAGLAASVSAPDRSEAVQKAYARADVALYEAKEAGRHRMVVDRAA